MLEHKSYMNNLMLRIQFVIIIFISYRFLFTNCQDPYKTLACLYPRLFSMQNGNNLLICKEGIFIYDPNFDQKISFDPLKKEITDNLEVELITISQYPNNGNIIIITKDKFYFLSSEGKVIFDDDLNLNIFLAGSGCEYYTLVPYKYENNYNFIVGFINNDKYFDIIYYKINISQQKIEIIKDYVPEIKNSLGYRQTNLYHGFDCEIMHSNVKGEVITCFHFDNFPGEIGAFSLYLSSSNIELIEDLCILHSITNIQPKFLKSVVSPDKTKALVVFSDMMAKGYYMTYDINSKEFSSEENYSNLNINYPSNIQVQYFSQTHEYIFSNTDQKNFKLAKFDENMNIIINDKLNSDNEKDFSLDGNSYGIYFYNIFFIPENNTYSFIMDTNLQGIIISRFFLLPKEFTPQKIYNNSFISYTESIPDNFPSLSSSNLPSTEYSSIITSSMVSTTYSEIQTIYPSIITTIPSTIIIKSTSNIITTIPSTIIIKSSSNIITTIPSTIIIKSSSDLITTIPSTIIIKSSSNIITTIPSTIIIKSSSNLITTIS